MNCWKGKCKYCTDNNICRVDNVACDMTEELVLGTGRLDYHCRQEHKEELRGISYDCALMPNAPLMPFWACENICKYYDTCTET